MKQGKDYKPSYEKQAVYYDAIYKAQGKDYQKEAAQIHEVVEKHKRSSGNNLLDVGCGTGGHFLLLVATDGKVEHFTELHELGLFTKQEYLSAFKNAGLVTTYDPEGITGRGLYIGVKRSLKELRNL